MTDALIQRALAQEIINLHHLGIAARDPAAACAVYCDWLGFRIQQEMDFPTQQVRITLLRKDTEWLEILVPTTLDSAVGRFLAQRGPGLHHVCYAVRDLANVQLRLQELHVQLGHAQVTEGVWGPVLFIHPKAAHGVMIELMELRQS